MGMGTGGGRRRAISEINVTPLVDVMLVLLIIFMISTPLIVKDDSERLIEMNLPVTRDNPTTVDLANTEQLILQIDASLRVVLGETLLTDCSAALPSANDPSAFAAAAELLRRASAEARPEPEAAGEREPLPARGHDDPIRLRCGLDEPNSMAGVTNVGMVTNPEFLTQEAESE